jgi:hypothetical protein
MSSIEVKLTTANQSDLRENTGVRFTRIEANGKQFGSPFRMINRNDLGAKSTIPALESIFEQSPVFIYEESFNIEKIKRLIEVNNVSSRLIDNMKHKFANSQHAALNLFLPAWSRDEKVVDELYNIPGLKEDFLYTSLRIQKLLDLPLKSVPIIVPYEASPSFSVDYVKNAIKKSGCSDEQLAIIIDMKIQNIETLKTIIKEFTGGENDLSPFILFRHQPEGKAIQAYRLINELQNEENTSYLFVDIENRELSDSLSTAHLSELQWGEGFAQRFKPLYPPKEPTEGGVKKKEKKPDPLELSFFRTDLGVIKLREMLGEGDHLEKIHHGYYVDSLVDKLNSNSATEDMIKAASAYSRIHELHLSSSEFKKSRSFMNTSTVDDYIDDKWRLKNHLPRRSKPLF